MRLLLYSLNFTPEPVGIGKYMGDMAEWLVQRGHEVKVICAPPYYPDWRIKRGYSGWRYRTEIIAGAEVVRCPLWVPKKVTGLKRLLHLASFALSSAFALLLQWRWRPDVVFAVEPPLFGALPALLTARLSGARAWLHVQDFEVDAAFHLGLLSSDRLARMAFAAERALMRRFDTISTISEKMVERAMLKTDRNVECLLFSNWVDTETIYPMDGPSPYRAMLGIPEQSIVLLYSGSMGEKQGIELILEAARALQPDPRYQFVMAGSGSAYQRLQQQAADLNNMRWLPLQPLEQLNAFLNLADIHLLPQKADAADLVMPSKLTGMLASGKPIIGTARPGTQVAQVLEQAGLVVQPGSLDGILSAIRQLGEDAAQRHQLGRGARDYAITVLKRERLLLGFEAQLQAGKVQLAALGAESN